MSISPGRKYTNQSDTVNANNLTRYDMTASLSGIQDEIIKMNSHLKRFLDGCGHNKTAVEKDRNVENI